jgi:Fibronectin type III domain
MNHLTRTGLCLTAGATLLFGAAPLASATLLTPTAVPTIVAPNPPTQAVVVAKRTKLKVSWQAPSGGPSPTGYQVKVTGRGWKDADGLKMTVKGLEPGTHYTVKLRSCINRVYSTVVTKHATTKG